MYEDREEVCSSLRRRERAAHRAASRCVQCKVSEAEQVTAPASYTSGRLCVNGLIVA